MKKNKIILSILLILSLFNINANTNQVDALVKSTGGATLSIPEYDETVGWKAGDIYTVTITADFGDNTSSGKELDFTLPDGLEFVQIPVVAGKYNTTNVDTGKLAAVDANDPLATAVSEIVLPTKEEITNLTFGKVVYKVANGTQAVSIAFKVKASERKIMTNHITNDPMLVSGVKNGSSIGEVSQSINLKTDTGNDKTLRYYRQAAPTQQTLANTATDVYVALGPQETLYGEHNGVYNKTYLKNRKVYVYYPEAAVFESVRNNPAGYTYTVDSANNRVVFEAPEMGDTMYVGYGTAVNFSFPEGTAPGVYTYGGSYFEYETYNGEIRTQEFPTTFQIEVKESINAMATIEAYNLNVDMSLDNHLHDGVKFRVQNAETFELKNQVVHYEIEQGLDARLVIFPLSSTKGNLSKVEYKLEGSNDWVSVSADTLSKVEKGVYLASLWVNDLGLKDGEKLSEIKAYVGDFEAGYMSTSSSFMGQTAPGVYSKLSETQKTTKSVKLTMYSDGTPEETVTKTGSLIGHVNTEGITTYSSSVSNFRDINDNKIISSVLAGSSVKFDGIYSVHRYPYGDITSIKSPVIYIIEKPGMNVIIDSLKLTDHNNKVVSPDKIEKYTIANGDNVYKVYAPKDMVLGTSFDETSKKLVVKTLKYSYDVATDIRLSGNYFMQDLIAFGNADDIQSSVSNAGGSPKFYTDTTNVDNNDATATLMTTSNPLLAIQENKNVLVETFLSIAGEDITKYIDGDASTITSYTPGTNATYVANVTNNSEEPANKFVLYVPIPKTGQDFGPGVQDEPFAWDMKISGPVTPPAGFVATYAIDGTIDNYEDPSIYKTDAEMTAEDYSKVNIVKLSSTAPLAVGAAHTLTIDMKVDETLLSATFGNKNRTTNIYNPAYDVDSTSFIGTLKGTKVGAELLLAEIGGLVFIDTNADGLYKEEDGDSTVAGHEVELYSLNETTGEYEPVVVGGNAVKTTTDENGVYLFDHTAGLGFETYAVRFVEMTGATYQYTPNATGIGNETIDSDAIINNDLPNAGDTYRGWVLGIDATHSDATTIGAGFLKYDPPVDLTLTLPASYEVKVGNDIVVKPSSIEPDFWENIKSTTSAYTWELVNSSDSQYVTLGATDKESINVNGTAVTPYGYEVELKLTIKDIYGQQKSATTVVKVFPDTPPTVTTSEIVLYEGDSVDYTVGVSAVDAYGNDVELNATSMVIDSSGVPMSDDVVTTAGTYEVTYEVTDIYDNTASVNRVVKVNGNVEVDASNQTYNIKEADIATTVSNAATASYLKASDVVGEAAVSTDVAISDVVVVSSTTDVIDYSKVGAYVVKYTATNEDSKSGDATVVVNIINDNTSTNEELALAANSFHIPLSEASSLTAELLSVKAEITAWNMINGDDLTRNVIVDVDDLAAINATTTEGVFPVKLTVSNNGITLTRTINVFVGGTVSADNTVVIYANGFNVHLDDAATYDAESAKVDSKLEAYVIESATLIDTADLTADINAINSATVIGNVDVVFTHEATGTSTTVVAVIYDDNTVVGTKDAIYALNSVVKLSEISTMTERELKDAVLVRSSSMAWDTTTGEDVEYDITSILKNLKEGVNTIELETVNGTKISVKVIVLPNPVADVDYTGAGATEVISAENIVIELSDLDPSDLDRFATMTGVVAYDVLTATEVSYSGDASAVIKEAGSHDLVYTSENGVVIVVKVTTGNNVYASGDYAIAADNITVHARDVAAVGEAGLSEMLTETSNAKAWKISTNSSETLNGTITASSTTLDMNDLKPYSHTFNYEYNSVSRNLLNIDTNAKVVVKDDYTAVGDEDYIYAYPFAILTSEVSDLNPTTVVEKARAGAALISDNSPVEIVEVDYSAVQAKPGVYPATFTSAYGTKTTINIFVDNDRLPEFVDGYAIYSDNYTLKLGTVMDVTNPEHISLANAIAYDVLTGEKVEITHVDITNLKDEVGVYNVMFGVNEDTYTTSAVTVVDDSTLTKTGMVNLVSISGVLVLLLASLRRLLKSYK